jgi:hypothetical protein
MPYSLKEDRDWYNQTQRGREKETDANNAAIDPS